jgi:hypothetical protein
LDSVFAAFTVHLCVDELSGLLSDADLHLDDHVVDKADEHAKRLLILEGQALEAVL